MKIAFIGLGNMGGPMAHNLHKAGHEVRAFDLSQPARDKLAADGVPIATDAKAAEYGAEVVISMLPASPPASMWIHSAQPTPPLWQRFWLVIGFAARPCSGIQRVAACGLWPRARCGL